MWFGVSLAILERAFCRYEKPCKNGARCEDVKSGYVCHCADGYTGRHCAGEDLCDNAKVFFFQFENSQPRGLAFSLGTAYPLWTKEFVRNASV